MLTSRGWWFLVPTLTMLALAVLVTHHGLTLFLLSLTLWFLAEMLVFSVRAHLVARRLRCTRELRDRGGPVAVLWAGLTIEVRVTLRLDGWLALPYVVVNEQVPFGLNVLHGATEHETAIGSGTPLEFVYQARARAPGEVRFIGLHMRLYDWQGFFMHQLAVPAAAVYRVLPPLVDAEGQPTTVKRHNLLPPPGTHRVRRPGTGSELLDLRDYLAGDPPKTIAWKVSARRDRLITKEFESEAPLRCTLFLDASKAVRLGPPGNNALTRLVSVAAAVAQAAAGARDLVGLAVVDEQQCSTALAPGRSRRHLVEFLGRLADTAALPPTSDLASAVQLVPIAYALAREAYPELLQPEINHVPFWLAWARPQPASMMPPLVRAERGNWFTWYLSARRRRLFRWRKQLAALLARQYRLPAGGLGRLLEDDPAFADFAQRFLSDHRVPYPLPLYDPDGRYLFASAEKVKILAAGLLRAVTRGRDNELYVLLADLLELADDLAPVLRAAQVAQARHHRVLVVCPWPPGIPAPPAVDPGLSAPTTARPKRLDVRHMLETATIDRLHRAFWRLRRSFARLGVPVLCAEGDDPVPVILDRLERLRTPGRPR